MLRTGEILKVVWSPDLTDRPSKDVEKVGIIRRVAIAIFAVGFFAALAVAFMRLFNLYVVDVPWFRTIGWFLLIGIMVFCVAVLIALLWKPRRKPTGGEPPRTA